MIEDTRSIDRVANSILILGIIFILAPLIFVVITATQSYEDFLKNSFSLIPGQAFWNNLHEVFTQTNLPLQTYNSIVISIICALGRVILGFTTAYAIVFFTAGYRPLIYAAVLASIMLPDELMIITLYQMAANIALPVNAVANFSGLWSALTGHPLNLQINILDTYTGIAVPMMAKGAATLIFVQFMRTVPPELAKAATMDGAGPLRFMIDILMPLMRGPMLAFGIYMFIGSWITYMWPLVAVSSPEHMVAVVGLTRLKESLPDVIPNFPLQMTGALLVTLPPLILIAFFQRQIVRGLTMSEK